MDVERKIFIDCYRFLEENLPVRQDQEYWAEIVRQSTEIEQKYPGEKMAVNMLYACTQRLCELLERKENQQIYESTNPRRPNSIALRSDQRPV